MIGSVYQSRKYLTPAAMVFRRIRSDLEWGSAALSEMLLPSHYCPAWQFRSPYADLWLMNYTSNSNHYSRRNVATNAHFIAITMILIQTSFFSFVPSVRNQSDVVILTNHLYSFPSFFGKSNWYHIDSLLPRECFPDNNNLGLFKSRVNR